MSTNKWTSMPNPTTGNKFEKVSALWLGRLKKAGKIQSFGRPEVLECAAELQAMNANDLLTWLANNNLASFFKD